MAPVPTAESRSWLRRTTSAAPCAALVLSGAPGAEIVNNTLYVPAGDAMRIENASTGANLRNNIVWADNGYGIRVSADSQTGFASDNNVFFRGLFGTGNVGFWNGADRGSFFQWRAASGPCAHAA